MESNLPSNPRTSGFPAKISNHRTLENWNPSSLRAFEASKFCRKKISLDKKQTPREKEANCYFLLVLVDIQKRTVLDLTFLKESMTRKALDL
jgi:hypothetical protein